MTDQCEGCTEAHRRIDGVVKDIEHLKQSNIERDSRFERHMDKEEAAFDNFYSALRSGLSALEDKVAALVMQSMEDRADMKDRIDEKLTDHKKEVERKHITRKELYAGAFVVGVFFTALTTGWMLYMQWDSKNSNQQASREIVHEVLCATGAVTEGCDK